MKSKYFLWVLLMAVSIFTQPVSAQGYELFGISPYGGETGSGAIYRFEENGDTSLVTSFFRVGGDVPTGSLCKASNGKLYGMASGLHNGIGGVLFEFDPVALKFAKKFAFFEDPFTHFGPSGSLMQAQNGKLYGMSRYNGSSGFGAIFEFDLATNVYTRKIILDSLKGRIFNGPLVQAGNGMIYGVTADGGANGCGVLFKWDPVNNIYLELLDFSKTENGSDMNGTFAVADNGKLYGITRSGGLNDLGVLFEWDPSTHTFVKKIDFDGAEYGSNPVGTLVQSENGKLYGVTYNGGSYGFGVLFEWDPYHDIFTKKFDFDSTEFGSHPFGSLVEMESGILVGMTYGSGTYSSGILFEWDPSANSFIGKSELPGEFDTFTGKYDKRILSSLVQAGNGKLYGVSPRGGFPTFYPANYSSGFLFEWDPVLHVLSVKLKFQEAEFGSYPVKLVEGDDGKLFGIALRGGIMNYGTIFQLDPVSGALTKKYDFTGHNKGVYPRSLMIADNGRLYGSASYEPDMNPGDIFYEWDPATELFSLPPVEGQQYSMVIQADNGKIYGTSHKYDWEEASKPDATLFELDPAAHQAITKYEFYKEQTGSNPHLLVKARNGKLYGIADYKAGNYNRILFEWDPATDTYEKKLDIADTVLIESLFQASNDKFYGAGNWGKRAIFYEWDAETNVYAVKLENDLKSATKGFVSDMIQGENGRLYGTLRSDEVYYIFEWDPANDYIEKIADINWLQEKKISSLLYRSKHLSGLGSGTQNHNIILYPNPTAGEFFIDLGSSHRRADISITRMDGRMIRRDCILNGRYKSLQMSEPPGVYLVFITVENDRAVIKISKK